MYSLDFLFYSPKEGDIPFTPFGQIYVKDHAKDKQGNILLSAKFMSKMEVDEQIDRLIWQLENIRKKAKKKMVY
jgi:hypothetical protein